MWQFYVSKRVKIKLKIKKLVASVTVFRSFVHISCWIKMTFYDMVMESLKLLLCSFSEIVFIWGERFLMQSFMCCWGADGALTWAARHFRGLEASRLFLSVDEVDSYRSCDPRLLVQLVLWGAWYKWNLVVNTWNFITI